MTKKWQWRKSTSDASVLESCFEFEARDELRVVGIYQQRFRLAAERKAVSTPENILWGIASGSYLLQGLLYGVEWIKKRTHVQLSWSFVSLSLLLCFLVGSDGKFRQRLNFMAFQTFRWVSRFLVECYDIGRVVTAAAIAPHIQTLLTILFRFLLKPPEYFLASNRDDRDFLVSRVEKTFFIIFLPS